MDSASRPGTAADKAEDRNCALYRNLSGTYRFEPLAIETTGVYGRTSSRLVAELGRRISTVTGDKRETSWLRLSAAIMKGNSASILATGTSD